jgi:hypothetical protein
MELKRIIWKSAPTLAQVQYMQGTTSFGPSCFERGLEWVFAYGQKECEHAPTPDGFSRIN